MPREFLAEEGTKPGSLRCEARPVPRSDACQASVALALEGQGVPIDRGGIDELVAVFAYAQLTLERSFHGHYGPAR